MDNITENAIQELMQHPDIKDLANSREVATEVLNRSQKRLAKYMSDYLMDGEPKEEVRGFFSELED